MMKKRVRILIILMLLVIPVGCTNNKGNKKEEKIVISNNFEIMSISSKHEEEIGKMTDSSISYMNTSKENQTLKYILVIQKDDKNNKVYEKKIDIDKTYKEMESGEINFEIKNGYKTSIEFYVLEK